MQENKPFIFQRFTQKRYEDYKKKGIEFYVINAEGHYCEIQAFNCGENKDCALVEEHKTLEGEDRICTYYASQKTGSTQYRGNTGKLFICQGPIFKTNNLVVQTNPHIAGRHIFFWHGCRPAKGEYISNWQAYSPFDDMSDSQFAQCSLGCTFHEGDMFRRANDKDIEDYQRALRDHRITWEDDGRFYHYPHLGDHYFEIYFENGRATFAERSFESEDERPPISRLIMECDLSVNQELREKRVRRRVRDINEALGLKEG